MLNSFLSIFNDQQINIDQFLGLIPIGVYVCDQYGVIKSFNPKAGQLWGRQPVLGSEKFSGFLNLYHPDGFSITKDASAVARCILTGHDLENVDLVIEKLDKTLVRVRESATLIKNETGHIIGIVGTCNETGVLQADEWEVKKKEYELQEYVDNAAMALHWVDGSGLIKWANKAELDMLGYEPDEYIGHHISKFHVHKYKIDDILERLGENQTLRQYETELICKDGSVRHVQLTSNVFMQNGEFVHTRCFTVDVTSAKMLLDSLTESEHRYRELFTGLPTAVYTCDIDGFIDSYNPAAVELWGKEPQPGKDLWCGSWKIFHPDGSALSIDECPMALALKGAKKNYGQEIVIERPDRSRRHVLAYPQPMYDAAGKMVGAVNMLVDVTSLKMAEEALRESEQRFRTAANTAPVLIWMGNTIKDRYFFNYCWTEFTGRSQEAFSGEGWMQCVHPDDLGYVNRVCDESFVERLEYKMRYRLLRSDGQYRWMHSHGIPKFAADGTFNGYIGTIVDVHEQKLRQEELKKHVSDRTQELRIANEKLERTNRQLEEFAYVASHDLQEPLRKINSLASLLTQRHASELDGGGMDLLARMQSAAERMGTLIEDLLSYSRVSSLPEKRLVNLEEQINGVLTDLDTIIAEQNASISLDTLHPVNGYAPQIRQLFQNLLSNSLKFASPTRKVVITITSQVVRAADTDFAVRGDDTDQIYQLIEVADNGIGFEQKHSERIFQIFQRLHGRSAYEGSGVGLSIVQKVVENHGGYIRATGRPDNGAVFQILLPML